jgi:hypothetical protein
VTLGSGADDATGTSVVVLRSSRVAVGIVVVSAWGVSVAVVTSITTDCVIDGCTLSTVAVNVAIVVGRGMGMGGVGRVSILTVKLSTSATSTTSPTFVKLIFDLSLAVSELSVAFILIPSS